MSGKAISKANGARLRAMDEHLQALLAQVMDDEPKPEGECGEAGKAAPPVQRTFTAQVLRAAPEGFTPLQEGTIIVVASEAIVDRYSDIVRQNWDLMNYMNNPVVLLAHDWKEPPIGKALQCAVLNGQLVAEILFDAADPEATTVARKYRDGFMNTVSVGFRSGIMSPRWRLQESDPEYAADGYILDRNELMEISCVSVPALPTALAQRQAPTLLDQVRLAIAKDAGFRNELEAELASSAPVVPTPANPGPDATTEAPTLEKWWGR